jgi:ATP-dependent helicase HepA
MILSHFQTALQAQLLQRTPEFEALLEETAAFSSRTRKELSEGRDKLLERSSCNAVQGEALGEAISRIEDPGVLGSYLEEMCAVTGVEHEEYGEFSSILRRGEQELLEIFPDIPEDGCTVTVSREQALQREDWLFLGWEHPWMENAMSTLIGSSLGQASVGAMTLKGVPAGSRLYEMLFTVSLSAPRALGLQRYLPLAPKRLLLDANGRDLSKLLTHARLNERVEKLPRGTVSKIVRELREEIEARIDDAEQSFATELASRQTEASNHYTQQLDEEIDRLRSLRAVNPAIRPQEIDELVARREAGIAALSTARATLQGVRLVLTR